jgi:hypothetical protein
MAFASSSSAGVAASSLGVFLLPPSKKLTRSNHVLWRVHVVAALQWERLASFIPLCRVSFIYLFIYLFILPDVGFNKEPCLRVT